MGIRSANMLACPQSNCQLKTLLKQRLRNINRLAFLAYFLPHKSFLFTIIQHFSEVVYSHLLEIQTIGISAALEVKYGS